MTLYHVTNGKQHEKAGGVLRKMEKDKGARPGPTVKKENIGAHSTIKRGERLMQKTLQQKKKEI